MIGTSEHSTYHESSIKPPPPPRGRGAYLFRAHLRGGDLFNLETTMVSVLHKELEYKDKKVEGHAAVDQNHIRTRPVGK